MLDSDDPSVDEKSVRQKISPIHPINTPMKKYASEKMKNIYT